MRRLAPALAVAFLLGCPAQGPLPAPEVSIQPANPAPADDLALVIRPLGEDEARPGLSWLIEWRTDGAAVPELDGAREVPADRTAAGETWQVTVRLQHRTEVGPPGEDQVEIRGAGPADDDDVAPDDDDTLDDDDSGAPDDDDIGDDDDIDPDPCSEDWTTPLLAAFDYEMVCLDPGTFTMGSPTSEEGRDTDELEHTVELTGHLAVGATEVTNEFFEHVTGRAPSDCEVGCDPGHPVQLVTWVEAVGFCNLLSSLEDLDPVYTVDDAVTWDPSADGYRLLTEAEWEHAARAGGAGPYAGSAQLEEVAVCVEVSAAIAGSRAPNAWGLFDMSGNVSEWVWDRYGFYPLTGPEAPDVDPDGPAEGTTRVHRGGSWRGPVAACRVADREHSEPDSLDNSVGFRIARTVP